MRNEKIELTQQDYEELKDEIRFRERVILELKQLNGIPKKVVELNTYMKVYGGLIIAIIIIILKQAWMK